MPPKVRRALTPDMEVITRIYAHHVQYGTGTFETEAPGVSEMQGR